ncbi:MAG: MATE family efflux transporter [Negativicutes bacterium]|nr:MATE family efflux transporter [Negativicutes bacterium]
MVTVKTYMRRQIFRLAWPVILEMSGIMLVSILVTVMVGSFGAIPLAAVGLATMVQFSSAMIFAAAGTGAAAIVARETGAGNWAEVRTVTGQALMLGIAAGVILAVLGRLAAKPVFLLIGADPAVGELATGLLEIMFWFTPFYLVMAIGNAVLRGMGLTRPAFLITTASNILALIVSYMLIFGRGVPAFGPYGAMWGTVVSQLAGGLMVLAVLTRNQRIRLGPQLVFSYRPAVVARIVAISLPAALEQTAMQGGRIAFTFMLAGIGAVQFAAHQIAVQAESLSFMPGFGFSVAAMTLTGIHLGKGLPHRAEQYVWLTNNIALWSMTAMSVIFIVFSRQITGLFIEDPAVVQWGAVCVAIAALEQPTIAITYVLGGALRGAGDTRWPMYVTATGIWLLRIPLVYLFIVVWGWDITVAWFVTAADFLVRSAVLWRRFSSGHWQKLKNP